MDKNNLKYNFQLRFKKSFCVIEPNAKKEENSIAYKEHSMLDKDRQ